MALQTSGQISLNDIHVEAGGSSGSQAALNDSDIRGLIDKASGAQMSFSEWYGASAETDLTSGGTVNGQAQRQEITVSSFISSGGTLVIPSSLWVWSDSTSTAALTIDIPCTIVNNGKILGKGGHAGNGSNGSGSAGGPAIKINSSVSGVTITNNSGAYIAGGGGGGGAYSKAGGGGGAGGGDGGDSTGSFGGGGGTSGASLNGSTSATAYTAGANCGGGGGLQDESSSGSEYGAGGTGGGRVFPGTTQTQHPGGRSGLLQLGLGGGGGVAGTNGGGQGNGKRGAGGGGWGSAGGSGIGSGGSAGKAIEDSGNSYSLSNSGTIYGATT